MSHKNVFFSFLSDRLPQHNNTLFFIYLLFGYFTCRASRCLYCVATHTPVQSESVDRWWVVTVTVNQIKCDFSKFIKSESSTGGKQLV